LAKYLGKFLLTLGKLFFSGVKANFPLIQLTSLSRQFFGGLLLFLFNIKLHQEESLPLFSQLRPVCC
jgi:hypothetical protein